MIHFHNFQTIFVEKKREKRYILIHIFKNIYTINNPFCYLFCIKVSINNNKKNKLKKKNLIFFCKRKSLFETNVQSIKKINKIDNK